VSEYLLPLAEVARLLELSEKRVYQLDEELKPVIVPRGTKMRTRWYSPVQVKAYRAKHQKPVPALADDDLDQMARDAAARRLNDYTDTAPFFLGASPADTDRIRERIRAIAKRTLKEAP